jgi:hypothetical protein
MILKNNIISLLFQSKERPLGHTWQYWTTKWWQWFLSIPKADNPTMDTARENFSLNRSHPNVWFLATTIGGRVERTVRITSGKALLFPIINVTISNAEDPTVTTETDMISFVKKHMDDIIEKRASIDGEELLISEKFRFESPPFKFSFPPNNIFGAHEGPTRGAADGYWIFMRPLQPGIHNISTFGSCMSGKIQIEAGIKLIIEEDSS